MNIWEFTKSEGRRVFHIIFFLLAGIEATRLGSGPFNMEASAAYKCLTQEQKENFQLRSAKSTSHPVTRRRVVQ